jgi:hypothetical protein
MGKSKRGGGFFDGIAGLLGKGRDAVGNTAEGIRDGAAGIAPGLVKPLATPAGTAKLAGAIGKPFAPEDSGRTMTGGRRTRKHRKHAKKTHRRRR